MKTLLETKNNPIGVFDSGVGGLTVAKAIKKIMPRESIVYFGDTLRVPYGTKSSEEIIKCAHDDIKFLKSHKSKIIVAACGTVSSHLKDVKCELGIIGVIDSACKAACKATKNGKIGVMATLATVKSGSYEKAILKENSRFEVFQQECSLLVPLIESAVITDKNKELCEAVKTYAESLLKNNVDTIVLGCTHYPIIENIIRKEAGNKIALINAGEEAAKYVKEYLQKENLNSDAKNCVRENFFVSGNAENFCKVANIFWGSNISENVKKADLNKL